MGSQAESVSSSLTSPAEQWLMPGSWADGAAGCAGGVGWVWGGWDGDGLVYSQDQALCPEGGEGCCCVWSTAGSHWDQQWNPVPTLAAQVSVVLGQVLSHPASISSQGVLPMNPSEPGSSARRALLPNPYLLPGCGAMLLKIISIKGPL